MKRFIESMGFLFTRRSLHVKTKHVLLAVVGMLILCFYIGVLVSKWLYSFRMMLFVIILFLMGLYGVHRFRRTKNKRYAAHIGLGALLLFVSVVGVQTQYFVYYHLVGVVGVILLLPVVRDVMRKK